MQQQLLNRSNIFAVDAGKYLINSGNNNIILYSPLAGKALLTNESKVSEYENLLLTNNESLDKTLSELLNYIPFEKRNQINRPEDIFKISVLPTHSCNLSCTYCYSAKGRNSIHLDKNKLKSSLEYFIDPGRIEKRYLHLSIIGGGEPMLNWDLVKFTIEYADELAEKGKFELDKILITNGTIISDEIINFLMDRNVVPNISFDILESAQNTQRKNYEKVVETITKFLDAGIYPTLNATITPSTANRQLEMAQTVFTKFPGISNLIFEPVIAEEYFPDQNSFNQFYSDFNNGFFEARKFGLKHNIEIRCKAFINMFNITNHGCEFRFSLTPGGEITNCYCVSSPEEKYFESRQIGNIDAGNKVRFNYEKFDSMVRNDVSQEKKCSECFIKWNCGGGCLLPKETYDQSYLDILCDQVRDFSVRVLIEKFELNKN